MLGKSKPKQNNRTKHMGKFKADEVVRGLDVAFPADNFTVEILDVKKSTSSNGNPMAVFEIEIKDPPTVKVGKAVVEVAGQTGKLYGLLDGTDPNKMSRMLGGLKRGGLDPRDVQGLAEDEVFSDEQEDLRKFIGKSFRMTISSKPRTAMRIPTPEERAAGIKAKPLVGPDGKELTTGNQLDLQWDNITGPAGSSDGF